MESVNEPVLPYRYRCQACGTTARMAARPNPGMVWLRCPCGAVMREDPEPEAVKPVSGGTSGL